MTQSRPAPPEWREIVWRRPMPVVCLRHLGVETEWLTTWRRLTALLFELGLAGPHTTAVGVLYDLPWKKSAHRVRYDACLTVDAPSLESDLQVAFGRCPGLRYEVIMGDRPLARMGVRHTRRLADMSVDLLSGALGQLSPQELQKRSEVGLPLYEVYPCSPVFTNHTVPVVELYETVHLTRLNAGTRHPDAVTPQCPRPVRRAS